MLRRTATFVCLVLAILLLAGFDKAVWKAFTKKNANFSVMMPGTPKEETATEQTAAGPIKLWQASVIGGTKAYFVSYSDLPKSTWKGDPKTMLEGARDGAAKRVQGKVVTDRELKLADRYPGREFKVLVGDKLELTQRVYLVKHRLYQVNMGCMVKGCTEAEVQEYLDSFKLLKAPK
ncbi:MAG: hypothetical protein H0T42_09510 [Deltaproteobacteria bacterium]|nr:hypothetical protein [Deltaproteobacteria bacterium]